ncbi:MAG: hypothetical protein JW937_01345 [Candidatus Omnitrophica bacterium]|nr:hypothetical protein [Candidatus Omnitrophota bacterium]
MSQTKWVTAGFILLSFCLLMACPGFADGEWDYAYGVVKSINGNQITLSEYDTITQEESETVYELSTALVVEGDIPLDQLQPGDEVDLEFENTEGVYIAKSLSAWRVPVEENYEIEDETAISSGMD